jgi:hypothetical protein
VRYGAAMALWRAGLISAEVLEVYRVAAAHDARDPAEMLAERAFGFRPGTPVAAPAGVCLQAARDYLLTACHPGAAEVRAGLPADPRPARRCCRTPTPVVERWLAGACGLCRGASPRWRRHRGRPRVLLWVTYDAYPRAEIGEAFAAGHAFASIIGEDAPFAATDFDLGLFLIAPACALPRPSPRGTRALRPADRPAWLALWSRAAADPEARASAGLEPAAQAASDQGGRSAVPVPVRLDPGCERAAPMSFRRMMGQSWRVAPWLRP